MKMIRWPAALLVVCGLFCATFPACRGIKVTQYHEVGAVASISPIATDIGTDVFRQGGNAFDAAVAVAFALAVVHPQAGNIGGGGFALIREASTGQVRSLDFRETAPLAAHESMFLDDSGEVIPGASNLGAQAAGVPGTVAGLYELWHDRGVLPWETLVRIAADLADTGFIVEEALAEKLARYRDDLHQFEAAAALYYPGGRTLQAGDRLLLPDLSATLYKIASEGRDGFYAGEVAELIDSTMREQGGLITLQDLTAYRPRWREPLAFTFDSLTVYSMGPPSSGGIVVGQILKLLEEFDTRQMQANSPAYLHLYAEASRLAFADRAEHLGDPDFWSVPDNLLSRSYLARRRTRIDPDQAGSSEQTGSGQPPVHESGETTHLSVCDRSGNMVSLTYTLNSNFGCKLVVAGAGFLLNNEMDDFSIKSGHPNNYGLVGGSANKIEPGKRMLSSMAPTLVLRDKAPYLILGSPGGSKIISAVAQVLINHIRFGLDPVAAVGQPRIHHQWLPDELQVEQGGYDVSVIQDLIRRGHNVQEVAEFGDVQLIAIDPIGLMESVSDPRNQGKASGY